MVADQPDSLRGQGVLVAVREVVNHVDGRRIVAVKDDRRGRRDRYADLTTKAHQEIWLNPHAIALLLIIQAMVGSCVSSHSGDRRMVRRYWTARESVKDTAEARPLQAV